MPAGGTIPPDGRPPKAKGVGKTARRHDLEAQAGVGNTDIQYGDRQRLEAAQRIAPRPKQQNASGQVAAQPSAGPRRKPNIEIPDAIEFMAGRAGGTLDPATVGQGGGAAAAAWQPFMRMMARDATMSGPLTTKILTQLSNLSSAPNETNVEIIDQNAAEDAIWQSIQ